MGDGIVLDASAALAVLLREPRAGVVKDVLTAAAGDRLLVVDLFWMEVVNALVRRHGWEPDAVVEALRDLDELGIETVPPDRPMTLVALDLAVAHGISVYDATHLALAEMAGMRLLTLDGGLARAAGARSAIRWRAGANEERTPYGKGMPVPDWARHGRYLAELRRLAGV